METTLQVADKTQLQVQFYFSEEIFLLTYIFGKKLEAYVETCVVESINNLMWFFSGVR